MKYVQSVGSPYVPASFVLQKSSIFADVHFSSCFASGVGFVSGAGFASGGGFVSADGFVSGGGFVSGAGFFVAGLLEPAVIKRGWRAAEE